MVTLHVSGADSNPTWPYPQDESIAPVEYGMLADAREEMYRIVDGWLAEGYHQTEAGIFLKGSLWRRVVIIDELGITWIPLVRDSLPLSYLFNILPRG